MADTYSLDELKRDLSGKKDAYTLEEMRNSMGVDNQQDSTIKNLAGGLARGAGSIGATLLSPLDAAARALNQGNPVEIGGVPVLGMDRRKLMDEAMQSMGVNRDSIAYQGGKLGAEVAGTAGMGGALARGLMFAPKLASAVASGGMVAPGANLATRMAGGAITGGASGALINPDDAALSAGVGAALPLVGPAAGLARKAAKNVLGTSTGAGAETFSTAYRAGKEGIDTFLNNMRGTVPMTDVLDSAKEALARMRIDRGDQYRSGMIDISNDKTVIDFAPIDNAIKSLQKMGSYKGQVINKNAAGTVDEVSGLVNQWKSLDPAEYHTPEGLDALKKAIGDVRDSTQFGTPGRKAADTAYNAVKAQIDMQAPTYSKVMRDYSQASSTLQEIERALSLGNKAAADTSMRKLQSLMRNNVNTNYGNRLNLARRLEEGGADIMPAVAGQAASSVTPRGLQGLAASGAGLASLANPSTLAALPFMSPRLMGELVYGLGAANRKLGNVARPLGLLDYNMGLAAQKIAPAITSD